MAVSVAYYSAEEVISELTLKTTQDHTTLLWPPLPRWSIWVGVIVPIMILAAQGIFLSLIARLMLPLPGGWTVNPKFGMVLAIWILGTGMMICATIYNLLFAARFRLTPRISLTFGTTEYSVMLPRFFIGRSRTHSLRTLASLEVKPVKDIFGRKKSFVLVLKPHNGFRKRFRFSTDRPDFPAQIEAAFLHHLQNSRHVGAPAQKDET